MIKSVIQLEIVGLFDDHWAAAMYEANPYEPPNLIDSSFVAGDQDLEAECLKRGWCGRTIRLRGKVDAVIQYKSWTPGESVFVNGDFVASCRNSFYWTAVAPRIDFTIDGGNTVHAATLFAKASYLKLLKLVHVSLVVDGFLVYDEFKNG